MISKDINKAIFQSLTGKYSWYLFQILSLAVLSRIFSPQMFGVLAALQVIVMFFQLVVSSGLAPAIIYADKLSKQQRDGIFTFTLLVGFSLSLLVYAFADYLFLWLGLGENAYLTAILISIILTSSLSMLPLAALQKDARFLTIAQAEIFSELLAFIMCLVMHFYYELGLIALLTKFALVPVLRFLFYYLKSAVTEIGRPTLGQDIKAVSILFDFAKFQFAFNILNYFSRNLDTLLITKYFGIATIGFYEKSYQVMRYPLQLFTFAITPALQPILTKYKDDVPLVEREFYRIALRLALLGFAVSFVLFWGSEEIVFIMFGPQWSETSIYLSLLSVSVPLQMVLSSTGGVYQALGKAKLQFYCGAFSSFINVSAITAGVIYQSVELLCIFLSLGFIINFVQCFYLLQLKVFQSKIDKNLVIIFILVTLPYLNLLFKNSKNVFDGVYVDAFVNLTQMGVMVVVPFIALFLFNKKITKIKL